MACPEAARDDPPEVGERRKFLISIAVLLQNPPSWLQPVATLVAAVITGFAAITVAAATYQLNRRQEEYKQQYEYRAKIIARIFALLTELQDAFEAWVAYYDNFRFTEREKRESRTAQISKKLGQLRIHYRKHALWVGKNTIKKLDTLYQEWDSTIFLVSSRVENAAAQAEHDGNPFVSSETEDFQQIKEWADSKLKTALKELELEFAAVLGTSELSEAPVRKHPIKRVVVGSLLSGLGGGLLVALADLDLASFSTCSFLVVGSTSLGLGVGLLLAAVRPIGGEE